MDEQKSATSGLGKAVARGALVMIALRFIVRAIGFISIAVLARLLTPEDFGVIGTASVVTGIFVILQSLGISEALARLRTVEHDHVCTAWTISLLQSLLVAAGIALIAPWASELLKEPRLTTVLYLSAMTPVLSALSSPGSLVLMRNLQFGQEFKLRISQKIFTTIITIAGVLYFGDYRGLVIGGLMGTAAATGLTYYLYPYTFSITLSKWRDFLGFSAWTMLQATAHYVGGVVDSIFVKRMSNADIFGNYYTSRDISRILVAELVSPASQALMPGLAKIQGDKPRMIAAAESATGAAIALALGIGVVVSSLSQEIASIVLGEKWKSAGSFIAPMAIAMAFGAIAEIHRGITAAMSRPQWTSYLMCLRAVLMIVACFVAAQSGDVVKIATAVAATSILTAIIDYAVIFYFLGQPMAVHRMFWRPSVAAIVALGTEIMLHANLDLGTFVGIIIKAPLVILLYLGTLFGLWILVGRPVGPEQLLARNWRLALEKFQCARKP